MGKDLKIIEIYLFYNKLWVNEDLYNRVDKRELYHTGISFKIKNDIKGS